ncbi:MAG: YdbH domain-containing protein, partial [Rhodospirillales bacterium]|nr:YdbH domain-containing protein [Rhodospirillales bacterium]
FAWRDGQIELVTGELAFDAVELSGEDWGSAALSLEATPAKVSARGELGSGTESFRLRFSTVLEDFLAKPRLGATVSLTADASAPLWRFLTVTRPSAGDIDLELAIEGGLPDGSPWSRDPGTLPEWISGAALTAEALLRLDGLALPEIVDKVDALVPVTARLEGRVLDLALSADADAEAAGVSRQFLERNGLLPDLLGDRLSLKLFAAGDQPFSARLRQDDTGRGLAVSGKARLTAQDRIDLAATGGVEITLDQALRLRNLTFHNIALTSTAGTLPGTPVTALNLSGDLSGSITGALESGEGADQAEITHDIKLKVSSLQAQLRRQEAPPLRITGAAGFGLSGALRQDGSYRGQAEVFRGRLELPDLALAIDGLAAHVPLTAPPPAVGAIGFSAQGIRDLAKPARFHPVALSGKLSPAGRALDLVAEVTAADGAAQVKLGGRHDLDSARGHLDAIVAKAEFRPGKLQPTSLSPLLDTFHDVLGPVEAKARFEWGPDGIRGTADLASNGLSFEVDGVRFEGLTGELRLDRLDPLHSPAGQRLTAERIDFGLSLEEIDVSYQLLPGTPVLARVQQAEFSTLGGRYRVGEALIDPAQAQQELTVQVVDLDLAKLFEQIAVEGLSGTGHLGGTLPMTVGPDGVTVSKARLKAQAPGVLRFSSATAAAALESGGESVALMLQALEDFHYDHFTVRASKQAAGETSLRIRLQGQNPEVLDGHPFKFNINLSGNLDPVLAALTQGRALSNNILGGAWKLEP